jgi:hypothetical protein
MATMKTEITAAFSLYISNGRSPSLYQKYWLIISFCCKIHPLDFWMSMLLAEWFLRLYLISGYVKEVNFKNKNTILRIIFAVYFKNSKLYTTHISPLNESSTRAFSIKFR